MPEFTFTISDAHLALLQAVVARYNEDNGTTLTVKQWVMRILKDACLHGQLGPFMEQYKEQAALAERAAIEAKVEELRTDLGGAE